MLKHLIAFFLWLTALSFTLSSALSAQTVSETDGDFELYSNGIVKCTNATVGDTGTLDGITYTKRSEAEITGGSLNQTQLEQSCISGVTALNNLFRVGHSSAVYPGLTPDISTWDVSSVTNLFSMFRNAFYAPNINNWDVSSVTSMASLFRDNGADLSSLSLSNWDVSQVTQMNHMFKSNNFNGDISGWDVGAVFTFGSMFNGNGFFNQDISGWNVSNAENMDNMLDNTILNFDLSNWCVSQFATAENGFASNTSLDEANKPAWGTCPTSTRKLRGNAGWRLISIPYDQPTLSDISDDVAIQGVTGGNDSDANPNVYTYDESGLFEVPSSMTTTLPNGTGLAVYVFNNSVNGSRPLPLDLDAQGTQITSDVTLNINSGASNLYTLVGNPFTTNLETDSIRAIGGDIQANIAFWSDEIGTYSAVDRTIINTGNNTAGYIIPSWQAFWVQTSDANVTSITIPTGGKVTRRRHNGYFSKVIANQPSADVNMVLSSASTRDESIRLSLRENASLDYDTYDFGKLTPLLPQYAILSFAHNNAFKSVESIPYDLMETVRIPLALQNMSPEQDFSLEWSGLDQVPTSLRIVLEDVENETIIDLREQKEYRFSSATSTQAKQNPLAALQHPAVQWKAKSSDNYRFWLRVEPLGVTSEIEEVPHFELLPNYPNPFNPSTTLSYRIAASERVQLLVYDITGRLISELVNQVQPAGYHQVTFRGDELASGVYFYELRTASFSQIQKMTLVK